MLTFNTGNLRPLTQSLIHNEAELYYNIDLTLYGSINTEDILSLFSLQQEKV